MYCCIQAVADANDISNLELGFDVKPKNAPEELNLQLKTFLHL